MFVSPELRALSGPFTRIAQAMAENFSVEVIPSGTECKTDGQKIYIPFTSDYLSEDKRQALNGLLDHEVAHVAEERVHKDAGRKSCLQFMKDAALCRAEKLLFNVFEDIRIETKWSGKFPGVSQNLSAASRNSADRYREKGVKGMNPWGVIGAAVIFKARGIEPVWLPEEYKPYLEALADELDDCEDMQWSEDALALAKRAYKKLKDLPPPPDSGEGEGDGEGGKGSGKPGKEGDDDKGAKAKKTEEGSESLFGTDADITDIISLAKDAMKKDVEDDVRSHERYVPHPECVALDRCYKGKDGDLSIYESAKEDVFSQIGALRSRQLMLLQTMLKSRIRGGVDEGELDSSELYRVRHGETNVFADLELAKKINTAVELLIDCSGSMGGNANEGNAAYYALRTAIALAESWESLRVPYEILGFTNMSSDAKWAVIHGRERSGLYVTRSPFEFPIFKGWNEKLQNCKARFSGIQGIHDNADGEAVMFAALRLAARREKRKILIVISDGMPCCHGVDHGMNNQYLSDVVKRVEKSGIEVVGIGAATESVERFYSNHMVVNELETMASSVFKALDNRLRRRVA